MRRITILGLAITAVLAITALAAASASATVLCKENTTACPAGSIYPNETAIAGTLKSGTKFELSGEILGSPFAISCTGSTVSGKTLNEKGTPLPGEISNLTFSGCSGCKTAESLNHPYLLTVEKTEGGKGTATVAEAGKGVPSLKFTGCPFTTTCLYGAEKLDFNLEGGNPAILAAKTATLARETGSSVLCPSSIAVKSFSYEITAPKPLYVTGGPKANESVFCKENTAACAPSATYASGTAITTNTGGPPEIKWKGLNIVCGSSEMSLKNTAESGNPLPVEISSITFPSCSNCKSVEAPTPISSSVKATTGGNGTLTTNFQLVLSQCAGLTCIYQGEKRTLTVTGGGAGIARLDTGVWELFKAPGSNGGCPNSMEFRTTYFVTTPTPLYVTKAEG